MANGGGDIIIKGGSVELEYDSRVYTSQGGGKHNNPDMKLRKIVVTDDNGVVKFDSGNENVLRWKVSITCNK